MSVTMEVWQVYETTCDQSENIPLSIAIRTKLLATFMTDSEATAHQRINKWLNERGSQVPLYVGHNHEIYPKLTIKVEPINVVKAIT